MIRRGRGWLPDPHDGRDFIVDALSSRVAVPDEHDCSHLLPPVQDQGALNSCVGVAFATAIYSAHVRRRELPAEMPSWLALWWLCRFDGGTEAHNSGTHIRTAARVANRRGFCRERWWPQTRDFALRPDHDAARLHMDQRKRDDTVRYERINDVGSAMLAAMRAVLAVDWPIVLGLWVGDEFDSVADEVVGPPKPGPTAGHAMVCCGYRPGAWLLRNSWGSSWGVDGCCWITDAYMLTALDPWTVPYAPPFSDQIA